MEQTITLYQYNQRQQTKTKATDKGVVFPSNECRIVTRKVLGKGMVQFLVPSILSPGLATRLVDMMKWNIEVDAKFHRDDRGTPEKYSKDDFNLAIWSLAAVKPAEVEVI